MDNKFELQAIVELFGHSRIAGKVSEQSIGGATFVRIDVPATKTQPPFTRFLNPSAIYAINPVTEDVATAIAERIESKPIQLWDAEEVMNRINALKQLKSAPVEERSEPPECCPNCGEPRSQCTCADG